MNVDTRNDLINALNKELNKNNTIELAKENYITNTGALDCTAFGIPIDDLRKTKAVIEQQEERYMKDSTDPMAVQYLSHLRIAKKCVNEIISLKIKQ